MGRQCYTSPWASLRDDEKGVEVVSAGEQLRRSLAEAGATASSALAGRCCAAKVEVQLHAHVTGLQRVGELSGGTRIHWLPVELEVFDCIGKVLDHLIFAQLDCVQIDQPTIA